MSLSARSVAFLFSLVAVATPRADAQDDPVGSTLLTPQVVESDTPTAGLDLGERLVRRLGRRWSDVHADLVPPDSGAVRGRGGRLAWRVPDFAVDRFDAVVEGGRLTRVVLDFSSAGPDFSDYAARLRSRHGRPGRGGFFAASDLGAPFDLAVDAGRQRLEFRAVAGQTVAADVPLPVQFRAAPSTAPAPPPADTTVYATADTPPEVVGGVGVLSRDAVYPADAQADGAAGVVVVQFVVEPDGSASGVTVLRAPDPRLGEAAAAAVRAARYWPAHVDGEPVRFRFSVPVRFVLPEPSAAGYADQEAAPLGGWKRVLDSVDWPREARALAVEGSFTAEVSVDARGAVEEAEVSDVVARPTREPTITSSTTRIVAAEDVAALEAEAARNRAAYRPVAIRESIRSAVLDALRAAQFVPEIRGGEAVAGRVRVNVPFRVEG